MEAHCLTLSPSIRTPSPSRDVTQVLESELHAQLDTTAEARPGALRDETASDGWQGDVVAFAACVADGLGSFPPIHARSHTLRTRF